MRDPGDAFHLAIPVADLDEALAFYVTGLGCHLARRYDDRITLDFFGDQVVCHLTAAEPQAPTSLYPRHFGITFRRREDFDDLWRLVELRHLPLFATISTRFEGTVEEHLTFVVHDPSHNLIEFKHYRDHRMMH